METARNEVHGPLEVEPTCFKRLIRGVGSFTRTLAAEVLPVPPFVELTVTELVFRPALVPFTLTEMVHEALAAKLAPLKLTVIEPAVAVVVPLQVVDRPFGLATSRPLGSESEKFTPVRAIAVFGLVMVNERVVVSFVKMGFAVKDFTMTGGSTTVSEEVP